jgi:2-keto-4-pentenoate hydratase
MTPGATREAAELLWRRWQDGGCIDALPVHCRPQTRAEGYAIQAELPLVSGQAVFGWKIAATSAAGQRHIGVDGPLAGRLLSERMQDSGAELALEGNRMRVAEAEFAFRMGRPLAPRTEPYSGAEVLAAVATLHPSIEVPNSRYVDYARAGAAQLIADNACAHYFVLGPATRFDWRSLDLAGHGVSAEVVGQRKEHGKGANVLGDPRAALAWLANEVSRLGVVLAAGQVVTTGTCVTPIAVAAGEHVVADFGVLGRVEARFGS